jgi:hypothetical protein
LFGRFVLTVCNSLLILTRLVAGIVGTGAWVIIKSADAISYSNLCVLGDTIQQLVAKDEVARQAAELDDSISIATKSSRFFLLCPPGAHSHEMPSTLRSNLKPVGFAAPDITGIAKSRFCF